MDPKVAREVFLGLALSLVPIIFLCVYRQFALLGVISFLICLIPFRPKK